MRRWVLRRKARARSSLVEAKALPLASPRFQFQPLAEIRQRGHAVGCGDGFGTRIELPLARAAGGHGAGGAGVETAHHSAGVAQQFEEEGLVADAQVLLFDQGDRQTRQFGDALGNVAALTG